MSSGATSILPDRLEPAGHVSRVQGHADRRLVTLHSEEVVHAAAEAFFEPRRRQLHEVVQGYSAQELAIVERLVRGLTTAAVASPSTTPA